MGTEPDQSNSVPMPGTVTPPGQPPEQPPTSNLQTEPVQSSASSEATPDDDPLWRTFPREVSEMRAYQETGDVANWQKYLSPENQQHYAADPTAFEPPEDKGLLRKTMEFGVNMGVAGMYGVVRAGESGLELVYDTVNIFDDWSGYEKIPNDWRFDKISKPMKPTGLLDGAVGSIAEYATGASLLKAFKYVGAIGKGIEYLSSLNKGTKLTMAAAQSLAVNYMFMDPTGDRLSNKVQEYVPNPLTAYLAAKPGNSRWTGRWKNMIEGGISDAAWEGFTVAAIKGLKYYKAHYRPDMTAIEKQKVTADAFGETLSQGERIKKENPELAKILDLEKLSEAVSNAPDGVATDDFSVASPAEEAAEHPVTTEYEVAENPGASTPVPPNTASETPAAAGGGRPPTDGGQPPAGGSREPVSPDELSYLVSNAEGENVRTPEERATAEQNALESAADEAVDAISPETPIQKVPSADKIKILTAKARALDRTDPARALQYRIHAIKQAAINVQKAAHKSVKAEKLQFRIAKIREELGWSKKEFDDTLNALFDSGELYSDSNLTGALPAGEEAKHFRDKNGVAHKTAVLKNPSDDALQPGIDSAVDDVRTRHTRGGEAEGQNVGGPAMTPAERHQTEMEETSAALDRLAGFVAGTNEKIDSGTEPQGFVKTSSVYNAENLPKDEQHMTNTLGEVFADERDPKQTTTQPMQVVAEAATEESNEWGRMNGLPNTPETILAKTAETADKLPFLVQYVNEQVIRLSAEVMELVKRLRGMGPGELRAALADDGEATKLLLRYKMVAFYKDRISTGIGRALNQFRHKIFGTPEDIQPMTSAEAMAKAESVVSGMAAGERVRELRVASLISDPMRQAHFLSRTTRFHRLMSAGVEYWMNMILSGPKTHITNIHGIINLWRTKNDHPRGIPMTKRVREIVERRLNAFDGQQQLFPYDKAWIRRNWDRMKIHLGLSEDPQFVPHSLRHTCASRLVQRGVPLQMVQAWLGHTAIQTTMRYSHLAPTSLYKVVDVLDEMS